METQDILKAKIGTKENSKLKPAKVTIIGVEIQTETKDGKKMKSPLINILCKHPQQEESMHITKVKCERISGKLEVVSLWANIDKEDGTIQKSSALAELLRFMKVDSIEGLTGKEIETIEQSKDEAWLCLKAY
jgi:hypothetical protein